MDTRFVKVKQNETASYTKWAYVDRASGAPLLRIICGKENTLSDTVEIYPRAKELGLTAEKIFDKIILDI